MVNFAFTTLMISSHPPDDCLLVSARVRQRKTRTTRHGMGVRTLPECESHGSYVVMAVGMCIIHLVSLEHAGMHQKMMADFN